MKGDLDTQVREEEGDDEIAMLGTYFNQMTRQLKGQRRQAAWPTPSRSSGAEGCLIQRAGVGLVRGCGASMRKGRVTLSSTSAAERLLDWQEDQQSLALSVAVPEFGALFERLRGSTRRAFVQEEIKVSRGKRQENLLVRMSKRMNEAGQARRLRGGLRRRDRSGFGAAHGGVG